MKDAGLLEALLKASNAALVASKEHPDSKVLREQADRLEEAWAAVSFLLLVAKDVNHWLCDTDRRDTAHQRQLDHALKHFGDDFV